jgi:hypothetical protein
METKVVQILSKMPGQRNRRYAAEGVRHLWFRHQSWIPAFAGMAMLGAPAVKIVIPAKAGIQVLPD